MTDAAASYCPSCQREVPDADWSYDEWACVQCVAARDAHPAWHAIQRVERGETTVRRRADLGCDWWLNYHLETSDGWLIEVFPDGETFSDWDYIESMTSPEGVRYEADCDVNSPPAHRLPYLLWYNWSPEDSQRWALLPTGWSHQPGAMARVRVEGAG